MGGRRHDIPLRTLGHLALCALLLGPWSGALDANDAATSVQSESIQHPLQGMRFVGPWILDGEEEYIEEFIFEDGKFWSRSCLEWGYSPAPYFVRHSPDGVHFYAQLASPEHGTLEFEGVFDGTTLDSTILWEKERWYWSLEQTYQFKGRPAATSE